MILCSAVGPCFPLATVFLGCFTTISRALQNNLAKIYSARNNIYAENFNLNLCTCDQSMALGTRTKFQLEILIRITILVIYRFRENIFWKAHETLVKHPPVPRTRFTKDLCAHNWFFFRYVFAFLIVWKYTLIYDCFSFKSKMCIF